MPNINKTYARNLAMPTEGTTKKKQELTKTQAFDKVIEGAADFFTEDKNGKDFVTQSLKLRDGTLDPSEDKPYEKLICELGKNRNNYWFTGSEVFPRGFQKTLAIGYIRDNANNSENMAFINKNFNFNGFKEWIHKNFNDEYPGIADNLTKKYYEHIKIDNNLNVKFGSTEYTNEINLTKLAVYPNEDDIPRSGLHQYQGEQTFFSQFKETLFDGEELRAGFKKTHGENLKLINKKNYSYKKPEGEYNAIAHLSTKDNLEIKIPVSGRGGGGEMRGEKLNIEIISYFEKNPESNLHDMFFSVERINISQVDVFQYGVNSYVNFSWNDFFSNNFPSHNKDNISAWRKKIAEAATCHVRNNLENRNSWKLLMKK